MLAAQRAKQIICAGRTPKNPRTTQRQGGCSHPQPISMTCDFSASLQYSLQNLLPSSGGQSQAPCAHVPVVSSDMSANLLTQACGFFSCGWIPWPYARPRDEVGHALSAQLLQPLSGEQ